MVDYDPFADVMLDDPFPVYARLRAESPVHYLERFDTWALSLFEDVWNAGEDPTTFMSPGPNLQTRGVEEANLMVEEFDDQIRAQDSVFVMNPPEHTAVRRKVARHFTPQGVRKLEPSLRAITRDLLAKALPQGRIDVIGDLAAQISVRAVCLLMGLPISDGDYLTGIVRRFFAREPGFDGMTPDALEASLELRAYLVEAVQARRRRGTDIDDAMATHMALGEPGEELTDEQVASHMTTLVVGGTETLPKVFAGGVLQLHRHPDQRAELAASPDLIPKAFEEIARYEMPTNFLARTVARDVTLRGQKLREGQGVIFLYRSANRDEREFDDPDRFDIHRGASRILSFGHGTHVCLGQHVAKLEARVMYEELLASVPDYEVVESAVVPARSEFVAGYLKMPIAFEPRELRS
ncbi:MAG: cytochrome P450 [Myxococcota bacterium]|nr:cytochrome P450 [Myxococcota bacterium]